MKLLEIVREVRRHLEENGRVSLRLLRRQYELDDEALDELIEELVDVQRVARREENVLVWAAQPKPDTVARAPVTARPAEQADARKIVTILFADLAGSTALHERLDPESVRQFMEGYYATMRAAVDAHGGTVVKLLGDGVMAAFGVPTVAEDDALRAVRAGMGMQQAFRHVAGEQSARVGDIGLRVAINTGEVVVNADHSDLLGDPVNVAARLQQEARNGDVVLGESTQRLVGALVTLTPLGSIALKGRAEAVKAYRVESLERPAVAGTAAFVGRDAELARLTAIRDAAVSAPAARLAVLLGSPGLGKSRLIDELGRRAGDSAVVITAHCDAAGGSTFAPLAAALRQWLAAGQTDGSDRTDGDDPSTVLEALLPESPERARIAGGIAALLAGSPAAPEETFFVVRRFLAALAQDKPVVLVIDDMHWAEPLLLDLVEHLVQWGSGVPLFVLVGARPELRELRSSLSTAGGLVADVLTLSGLDASAAMRLAANEIGAVDLPAAVAAKVLATSEGNPLFVRELVRMLVDEGAIERQGERWIVGANLAALEMPPTIHALLAARIERLRPTERTVLERAAIVGRHFSRNAVAALLSRNGGDSRAIAPGEGPELDARLEALRRSELIEPDNGWFLGEPMLRFHHVLIRDAAYRRLLKGTRAELHARFAEWVAARAGEADHDETIGWHLEQAHQLLRELGPLDDAGRALGEQAAHRLAAAGRRALGRDDLSVAADLLGRAIDRLDPADATRADLALDWCEALLSAGDVSAATRAIGELERFAQDKGLGGNGITGFGVSSESPVPLNPLIPNPLRIRAWHTCFTGQLTALTAPEQLQATADAVAAAAEELAKLDDAAGEAKAHSVRAQALARLGKVGACEAALDQALAAARKAGDRRRANAVLAGAPVAALWGPSPVTRASGRCLDVVRVLRITQGAPAVEAVALSCQAVLEALRGRTDAARRMLASSRKMVEDLGIAQRLFEVDFFAGRIELLEGDAAGAERLLRPAYEGLRDLGLGIDAARAGALLARALLAQQRIDDAEALSHESELLAGDDLQAAIAWRGVRAEALAMRGEHAAAVELAKAAVAIASATDALLDHADARVALATTLRAVGRSADADAEERRAIELWEAKGATLLVERARRPEVRVEPLPHAHPPRGEPHQARRSVRANAVTVLLGDFERAAAARDARALRANFDDSAECVDHPVGTKYGPDGMVTGVMRLMQSRDPTYRTTPLATLGERWGLFRRRMCASGAGGARFDVGAYEIDDILVCGSSGLGRTGHVEIFAGDHLGDAIACLYRRYAELLPDTPSPEGSGAPATLSPGGSGAQAGPERERAAATARAVTALLAGSPNLDGFCAALAPGFELVDHRVLGSAPVRGAESMREYLRAMFETEHFGLRADDVLGLRFEAILFRQTTLGTARGDGGAYDRPLLSLWLFGDDGRIVRIEEFDVDREAEALARFDALAADDESKRPLRRVRANAASAMQARFDAALAARDFDAITAVFHEDHQEIDHPTGSSYGREAAIASLHRLFRSRNPHYEVEPLATLGDLLLLVRRRAGAAGTASVRYDVGAYENEAIQLFEVDASGLCRRAEVFATNRLGDAIVRLYERHAELLPEGPARTRAAGAARFVAAWNGPIDPDHLAAVYAPSLRNVDHRFLGTWSARNAEEILGHFRLQLDLAPDFAARYEDVFAVAADALVASITFFGTARDSGGAFENRICAFFTFGADGLVTETEVFEAEQVGEALARFDALVAGAAPPQPARRRTRPNAATRGVERFKSALATRDAAALADVFDESLHVVHHPTRAAYGRREMLGTWRSVIKAERFDFHSEILASLGGALALERHFLALEGLSEAHVAGFGRTEFHEIALIEADDRGRWLHCEIFAADRLRSALIRMYERRAESLPQCPARTRASGTARSLAGFDGLLDADRIASVHAPSFVCVDHRTLGTWSAKGRDEWHAHWRGQAELATDWMLRDDDVLAFEPAEMVLRQTFLGTGVASGGAFENAVICVITLDADGLIAHTEVFEPDQEAEALACLDALVGNAAQPESSFANAASRLVERGVCSWAARDWDGLVAELSPAVRMDDRRRMMRLEIGYADFVAQFRMLFDQPASRWHATLLATRGERLSLHRTSFAAEVAGGGGALAFDDHLSLTEVDREGRWIAAVTFDLADHEAAYAELDARYYAAEGAMHAAHGAIMRAFARAVVSRDWDPVLALCAPEFIEHDHRSLAVLGTTRGAAAWTQNFSTLVDLAPDTVYRVDHFRSAARGFCSVGTWVGSRDGGRYEIPLIAILELDDRDRLARADIYDPDQLDQALARFAELARPEPVGSVHPFANAATASAEPVIRCMVAHDWEGFRQLFAEDFHMSDRRRVVQLELDRDQYVAFTREVADGRTIRNRWELVATRGDRLAVTRAFYEFTDADVGPSEIAFLILMEVDEHGRIVANVRWDLDDLDAATAEIDARWEAGEAAEYARASSWLRDFAATRDRPDPDTMAAFFSPLFVARDHRLVGWGTLHGPVAFLETLRTLDQFAPDVRFQVDHLRASSRGILSAGAWLGTRDGGAFESPLTSVVELDAHGTALRLDLYDPHHLERALARFAEIGAAEAQAGEAAGGGHAPLRVADPPHVANAATRALERGTSALGRRDWEGFASLFAADFRVYDRTALGHIDSDAAQWLAAFRQMVEMTSGQPERQVLATRGERLMVARVLWRGAEGDVGPSEVEWLLLIEVDERGDHLVVVSFNPNDLDAAYAELDARWEAGEGAAHASVIGWRRDFGAALERRDWAAIAALYAPAIVGHDHRLVSWGTLHGKAAFFQSLRQMVDLAPDAHLQADHVRTSSRGMLSASMWTGTREGGAFESPFVSVVELDAHRLAVRNDFYDPHHLDRALARLEAIRAGVRSDPLAAAVKGNAASAALDRWPVFDIGAATDWDALRASCAPHMIFEDRQGFARLSGDREMMIASLRERVASGARAERRLLGTAGERVAITRMLWTGGPTDGRFEIEYLSMFEIDAAGLVVAIIIFDPDDARAAQREAWARWAGIDPAAGAVTAVYGDVLDAANDRDLARYRALFADELVVEDHRHGMRIEGLDTYAEQVALLWQHAPDSRIDGGWVWPAVARHGAVTVARRSGALADELLWLFTVEHGHIARIEVFPLDAVDAAVARLAELRSDPLRIPPNAATQVYKRIPAYVAAKDWAALRATCEPVVWEDRRRLFRLKGGPQLFFDNLRQIGEIGLQPEVTLLATAGERLALSHVLWRRHEDGHASEMEVLELIEVDGDGRLTAVVIFDPDDRAAADTELFERYVAGGADGLPRGSIEYARGLNARDLVRARTGLCDDFVLEDHRRTGMGHLEGGDAYIASVAAAYELRRELNVRPIYTAAVAPHGRVVMVRATGTNAEGGAFETFYAAVVLYRDGRNALFEFFEPEDLDTALARFRELGAASP